MYNSFYGFSEDPFRDTPDPRFLFTFPGQESALSCLLQGIEEKKGWILLSGEPGSGKTILIRHLLPYLQEKPGFKTVYIFQTRISFEDLLREILSELNLPPAPPGGGLIAEHFSRCVSSSLSADETLALFLDEAQDLSIEVLEKIHRFFGKDYPHPERIQIIFSGQTPLEEKLDSPPLRPLRQRIGCRCALKPLGGPDARRYIDHRVHRAGGKADIFSPEALDLILSRGEGIPRILNIICDNALRIGHQISEPRISANIVRKALKEMYLQADQRGATRKRAGRKPVLAKALYSLAAVVALLALVLFIGEYSRKEEGGASAKAGTTGEKIGQEELPPTSAKPEERLLQEIDAEPPPPGKQTDSSSPGQQSPPPRVFLEEKAQAAQARVKKIIHIKEGATLNSLCLENYGFTHTTLLDQIMDLNPGLTNPHLILVNQKILLPNIREEFLIREKPDGKFQIFLGTFFDPDFVRTFRGHPLLKDREIENTPLRLKNGETWHRLTAGMFASREEALETIRTLKEKDLLPSFGGAAQKGRKTR